MTDSTNDRNEEPEAADALPSETPESQGALSIPPPVPRTEPGFFRRLFMSRKKQQAIAVQNGYLEMVDLIRAIRSHLDRQETVQTRVLSMLEKVPDAMDRQHEVLSLFKQQLESNLDNDRRLSDSMGRLSGTLDAMDESQKSSSRTITDLITRSRESEQLLREVMRRAERRMTLLIAFFILLVIGMGFYLVHWQNRGERLRAAGLEPVAEETVVTPAFVPETEPELLPDAPDPEPAADAPPAPEPLPADEPEAVEPEPAGPEAEVDAAPEEAVVPPPAEDAEDAKVEPVTEAKPRPRGRPRSRPEDAKVETVTEPTTEEADAPAVDDTPPAVVEESAAEEQPAVPEEDQVAEPAAETDAGADTASQSDALLGESSEEIRLHQLKVVIGEAMLDAFGPSDKAPVSRR